MNEQPAQRFCPVCGGPLKPHNTTYDRPECRREAEHLPPPKTQFNLQHTGLGVPGCPGAYRAGYSR